MKGKFQSCFLSANAEVLGLAVVIKKCLKFIALEKNVVENFYPLQSWHKSNYKLSAKIVFLKL